MSGTMAIVPRRSFQLENVRELPDGLPRDAQVRQLSVLGNNRSGPSMASTRGLSGDQALREAYYANVYYFACVRAIATDLAARPFKIGADPDNPSDFDPKHPLAQRLSPPPGGPNPTTTSRRLWAWSAAQRLVFGAMAWEIDNDLRFWPLPGTKFEAVPQTDPKKVATQGWFKEFKLAGTGSKALPPERVFYSWNPAQDDWVRPETPLQAARLDVQVMVMQDIYDAAFLRNDARPAALVVHQNFTTPEAETKFRRQFLNRHQGVFNAGRIAFAKATPSEGGAAPKDAIFIQQLGLSQSDAKFIERYDAKIRSLCIAMGVPLTRLGDASKRTFSNAEEEIGMYWLNTVQPLGLALQDDVNLNVMPRFDNSGNVGFFDWSGIPALEPVKRFAVGEVITLHQSGLLTDPEARNELGLDPDVELPAAPNNVVPIAAAAPQATLTAVDVANILDDALAPLQAAMRSSRHMRRDADLPVLDIEAEAQAAYEQRTHIWRAVDSATRRMETTWERRIQKLLDRQLRAVLDRLDGKRGRQMLRDAAEPTGKIEASAVFDKIHWTAESEDVFDDLYRGTVGASLSAFEVSFGVAFDVDAPWAADYIAERSNMLAGFVTDTTYEAIKAQLIEGAAEGESIPKLAARIRNLFEVTWPNRAETIARTEVISAYNGSTWLAVHNAPEDVIGGLQWIATRDNRTRPTHAAMDGTIIRRGEAFYLDGATMMYPGDPEVATRYDSSGNVPDPGSVIVNCRCTVAPILTSELPKRERSARDRIALRDAEAMFVGLATGTLTAHQALATVGAARAGAAADPPTPAPAPIEPPVSHEQRVVVEVKNALQTLHIRRDPETGNIVSLSPDPE